MRSRPLSRDTGLLKMALTSPDGLPQDATSVAAAIAQGAVSADEILAEAQQRLATAHDQYNVVAWWVTRPQAAKPGPFEGVPIVLKDNEAWPGVPLTFGSNALGSSPTSSPSRYAAQLAGLGFVVIAKTTMPELGLTATTEGHRFGATRNPRSPARTAGGSSGGSAAAVAAGAVSLAQGNDGGGSLRIPAAACGLTSFKPTLGRVVLPDRTDNLPIPLGTQGVLTHSVRDQVAILQALNAHRPDSGLEPIRGRGASGALRIGVFIDSYYNMPADGPTIAAVYRAATALEHLGHHIDYISNPFANQVARDFLRYWQTNAFFLREAGPFIFGEFDAAALTPFTNGLADRARWQLPNMPATIRRLKQLRTISEAVYRRYDLLLHPVIGSLPPPIGYLGPDVPFETLLPRVVRFASFTAYANIAGTPAIALPTTGDAHSDHMPVGVQLAGPHGADNRVLDVAADLEEAQTRPLA